jgi:hypothetical protein
MQILSASGIDPNRTLVRADQPAPFSTIVRRYSYLAERM